MFLLLILVHLIETLMLLKTGLAIQHLGYEAEWRENEDKVKRAILILDPTQRATDDGFVIGWNVYTTRGRRSQSVHLQIWRPTKPAEHRYHLVGETVIAALWVGQNYFALKPQDRIRVRRGDVLGIYFPNYNPIPWSPMPCHHGNEHLFKYNPYSVTMVMSGQQEIVFETGKKDWNPCRQYSLNATIVDALEMSRYDYDYEETTDGRYERRPYGPYLPSRRYNSRASGRWRPTTTNGLTLLLLLAALLLQLMLING